MRTIPFSSLNKKQLAQAAYLFADETFGTDASAFVYEVDGEEVKGRVTREKVEARSWKGDVVKVTLLPEVNITEEMSQRVSMNMDALSASVARKIYQEQFEEVKYEQQ